jgi:AraC family transcriptional regulator
MRVEPSLDLKAFNTSVSRRFGMLPLKTFFARAASGNPIAISRIVAPPMRTKAPPPEAAFAVNVHLARRSAAEMWLGARPTGTVPLRAGDVCLADLSASPSVLIQAPIDFLRIQISQRTLDDLAYDRGTRPVGGLRLALGEPDPVLHGLSSALLARFDSYGPEDRLFLDHVALALHVHIAQTYGQMRDTLPQRGGLAPWQLRRACELMVARLAGEVSVAELAQVCGLSLSQFAHAFRQTTGLPPHRWLMAERVRRAKDLLRSSAMTLPEIALTCGFSDQSHLTRVFSRLQGQTPGRWRRLSLG